MATQTKGIFIRISPEELEIIDAAAAKVKMNRTEYLIKRATQEDEETVPIKKTETRAGRYLLQEVEDDDGNKCWGYVLTPGLSPNDSHWTRGGEKYNWSGRYDEKEFKIMENFLHSIQLNPLYAIHWFRALNDLELADARKEVPNNICAAFLQYIRSHKIPVGRYGKMMKDLHFTDSDLNSCFNNLSCSLTWNKGYLVGVYPWIGM
jgi:hypothetical protein